eukprot:m51a1_g2468 putative transcriptional sir2 family protein (467) ;mRNA; r:36099-37602
MADTVDHTRIAEHTDSDSVLAKKIDSLARLVRGSSYTVFFTGAGVSTSSGVSDYRGPNGAWTKRRINQLAVLEGTGGISAEQADELATLRREAARAPKKSAKKVDMQDAEPSVTHMAMATLIRLGYAHYVVTTNLDGIFRKAGLKGHTQLCCLHGDVYIERCTACGYDFERNYHVRRNIHVHDHAVGQCSRCGSALPAAYTGQPTARKTGAGTVFSMNGLISTRDANAGTKDTHINFGELLDDMDWTEAEENCRKAELCIVAGTSMSLRHITHFPFMAKKCVIINLQQTPDDSKADLRIWATCDDVLMGLCEKLGVTIDAVPAWHPRDAQTIEEIPKWLDPYYVGFAYTLAQRAVKLGGLLIGNTHEAVDPDHHRWTAFVRPAPEIATVDLWAVISSVTFELHPTFTPSSVKVTKPPYEVTRIGWGTFDVTVTVAWRCKEWGESTTFVHTLDFEAPQSATVHPVNK